MLFRICPLLIVLVCIFGSAASAPAPKNSEPVVVRFWYSKPGTYIQESYEHIISAFNASQKKIRVVGRNVAGSTIDDVTNINQLKVAIASGRAPDIYLLDRFMVAEWASKLLLTDITHLVEEEEPALAEQYLPAAWNEVQYRKRIFGLPFNTDTRALFFRPDHLKAHGIDPEIFKPKGRAITIAEFIKIIDKMDKIEDSGKLRSLAFIPWLYQGMHFTWGFAFGGRFYDVQNCRITPTDPAVVEAFLFLQNRARRYGYDQIDTYLGKDLNLSNYHLDPLIAGKVSFKIDGVWFIETMAKGNLKTQIPWDVTYLPTIDGRITSWSGGWSLVIPRKSKRVREAYQFMRFMAGEQGQRLALGSEALPTWKRLIEDPDILPSHAFFKRLLPHSLSRPTLPIGALYWKELTTVQSQVLSDPNADVKQLLSRAQDKLQKRMDFHCR